MIRDDNYYQVSGWMVTDLGLKGVELDVFAIIYGFSQDERSEYSGGIKYLMEWTGTTKKTVMSALEKLLEKGYITKREIEIASHLKLCNYSQSIPAVQNLHRGRCKNNPEGGVKITPNNKLNNKENNKEYIGEKEIRHHIPPTLEQVRAYCEERSNGIDPERFIDYYASQNWKLANGNKMADWQSAVRNWERRNKERSNGNTGTGRKDSTGHPKQRDRYEEVDELFF